MRCSIPTLWPLQNPQGRQTLRPIVLAVGSTTYNLAKLLTKILNPLTEKLRHKFLSLAECIHDTTLAENNKMVSFAVVSLFTKVQLTETIEVISHRLQQDDTLEVRSGLPPSEILTIFPVRGIVL